MIFKSEKQKISKTIRNITYQPKAFEIADIKSDFTEHSRTAHKLSKTIKNGKNIGSNSSLYSDTK